MTFFELPFFGVLICESYISQGVMLGDKAQDFNVTNQILVFLLLKIFIVNLVDLFLIPFYVGLVNYRA